MRSARAIAVLAGVLALPAPVAAARADPGGRLHAERGSMPAHMGRRAEQVAWVRRAAVRFVDAELAGSGSDACAVLYAPLRAARHGRSCQQRWNARLARKLHTGGERALLRAQLRQIARAPVNVHGRGAIVELPHALLDGSSSFVWSEGCWMLSGG